MRSPNKILSNLRLHKDTFNTPLTTRVQWNGSWYSRQYVCVREAICGQQQWGGEEKGMGYNLIRTCIMSGIPRRQKQGINTEWKCCLGALQSPGVNSANSQYVIQWEATLILAPINNCQRHRWAPVALVTVPCWNVNQHLSLGIYYQPTISGWCPRSLSFFSSYLKPHTIPPSAERNLGFKSCIH